MLAGCVFLLLGACGGSDSGPESVAGQFREAVNNGDDEDTAVRLGTATESNGAVTIPTTLITRAGSETSEMPATTCLVQEDGAWRVDWNQTMGSLFGGMMGEMMKGMGKAAREMGKAVEESFREGMEQQEP